MLCRLKPARSIGRTSARRLCTARLPERVDAVVIGGGCVGSSVAYHLQQRGLQTLLLEAHALTAGTTWHTAGMLWRLRPSYVDIELNTVTRELAKSLEAETGQASWTENGGLFVACNKERLAEYARMGQTGTYYGIDSSVLSPAEAKEVHPLLNVDDVYGALYSPTDGTLDPTGLVTQYTKAAKALGATVVEGVRVGAVETEAVHSLLAGGEARRVSGVVTADGQRVATTHVVNACGAWAGAVSAMVGAPLPLLAMKHAYVVTGALEGMHGGLPNVRDHDLSVYLKAQGNALAIGGYETNPEFWPDVDPEFSFGLFELDWETFLQACRPGAAATPALQPPQLCSPSAPHLHSTALWPATSAPPPPLRTPPHTLGLPASRDPVSCPAPPLPAQNMTGHIQRCPAIEATGIQSTVCGPESFTPDHKPLVGPQPGVRGFWQARSRPISVPSLPSSGRSRRVGGARVRQACGFNSMGMMMSGGIGQELAECRPPPFSSLGPAGHGRLSPPPH